MVHLLQAKPNIPNYTFSFTILIVHKTPFLEKSGKGVFYLDLKRQERTVKKLRYLTINHNGNVQIRCEAVQKTLDY